MDLTNAPTMSQTSVELWKDIWWIKSIVLFLIFVVCCLSYQVLVTIVRFLDAGKAYNIENNVDTDETSLSGHKTLISTCENTAAHTQAHQEMTSHAAQASPLEYSSMNHFKTVESEEDDIDKFHDLSHHGIHFYDDNMSSSSLHRRTRMHSTVSEASLASMVRNHQRPGPTVLSPPPFPKLDDSFNESDNSSANYDQHFSSGDMRFSKQDKPTSLSRLSIVMEEDSMDSAMSLDRANRKITDDCCNTNFQRKNTWRTGTERAMSHANQRPVEKLLNKSHKIDEATSIERDKKVSKITSNYGSTCKPKCSVNNAATSTTMTPSCPSLTVDKNSRSLSLSKNLECSICKSKIHCLCKTCSSLCLQERVSQEFTKPFRNDDADDTIDDQYYPYIQEEFIDENFEDMESIVSDEITDSKS